MLAWEYRQRNLSKGVWLRLRRELTAAREAWRIDATDAEVLLAQGYVPLPVGDELEPPKRIFVTARATVEALPSARLVPLRLRGELISGTDIVLVPFDEAAVAGR